MPPAVTTQLQYKVDITASFDANIRLDHRAKGVHEILRRGQSSTYPDAILTRTPGHPPAFRRASRIVETGGRILKHTFQYQGSSKAGAQAGPMSRDLCMPMKRSQCKGFLLLRQFEERMDEHSTAWWVMMRKFRCACRPRSSHS